MQQIIQTFSWFEERFFSTDSEGNVKGIKFKGPYNKPHKESVLSQKNKKYVPVVSTKKKLFKLEEEASFLLRMMMIFTLQQMNKNF